MILRKQCGKKCVYSRTFSKNKERSDCLLITIFKLIGFIYCTNSKLLKPIGLSLLFLFIGDIAANISILFLYDYFMEIGTIEIYHTIESIFMLSLELMAIVFFWLGLKRIRGYEKNNIEDATK